MNLTLHNIHYTNVRIVDLCWALLYTIYRVTSYLRLLPLSILTCNPNMSFLARLDSNNSTRLEKFQLGHCSPSHALIKQFCMRSSFVYRKLRVRFDLPSSINFRYINGFPKLVGSESLLRVTLESRVVLLDSMGTISY